MSLKQIGPSEEKISELETQQQKLPKMKKRGKYKQNKSKIKPK